MAFAGFDTRGFKHARILSVTLGGPGRDTVVEECRIEVEYDDGHFEEHNPEFDGETMHVATLNALIAHMNRSIGHD